MFLVSFGNTFEHSSQSMMIIGTFIRSVVIEFLSAGHRESTLENSQDSIPVLVMQ